MNFKLCHRAILLCAVCLSLLALSACTNGGSDDDQNDGGGDGPNQPTLSENACSSLGLGTRIISGTECSENNSPVMELTITLPDGRLGTCSGTLITSRYVLTAAHCFFERPVRTVASASGVSVDAESIAVHPDVRVDESQLSVFNDVALVRLASPVTLPTLPILGSRSAVVGDVISIFGYGQTENQSSGTDTVGRLRSGEMSISGVNSNFIDARYDGEGSNTCSGDSGGPALVNVNGRQAIAGVLSSGSFVNCDVGDTSRFSNLQSASIFNFITSVVRDVEIL